MDKNSEGNEVGKIEINQRVKENKKKAFYVRKIQAKTYFLI